MKTLTIKISDAAYKRIRSEVTVARLVSPEGLSFKDEFLFKLFGAWDKDEVPEIKLKSEGEK